jgi:hypothetical protein
MFYLKLEENYSYIWTCHVEICSSVVLIKMGFRKFNHHHAKHAVEDEYLIFKFKIKKQIHSIIKNSKNLNIYTYIDTARRIILGFYNNYD